MKRSFSKCLLMALVFASSSAVAARAGTVTGDPSADGWDFNGRSLDLGTFVYTNSIDYDKLFVFDVYSTSFNLEAGSSLVGDGWQAGDLILGIGAVVAKTTSLNQNVRILAKYGAADAEFVASSFEPADPIPPKPWTPPLSNPATPNLYGDGVGSSSRSGTGGVVVETPQIWGGNTPWFNPTNAGDVVLLDGTTQPVGDPDGKAAHVDRILGGSGSNIDAYDVAKMIYLIDNPGGLLSSFETYLNVSQLERAGFAANPGPDGKFILAIQNQASDYTKAIGGFEAVPEPGSLVLAAFGLGGVGLMYLRRRP